MLVKVDTNVRPRFVYIVKKMAYSQKTVDKGTNFI